jgi:ubiquinone/menaquinone biosynthesis C-methylase UbiE
MIPDETARMDAVLDALKGAAESTRLRILSVLDAGELTVSELTQVLAQSQPRISRHLKLLVDAGLIERRREGSWAFFRLRRNGFPARLAAFTLAAMDPDAPDLRRDAERLDRVRRRRDDVAEAYFRENASEWDRLRALHASEEAVEAAARAMLVPKDGARFTQLLDLGTGTGRMLAVLADRAEIAIGFDINQDMLAFARSRLEKANLPNAELRQGDILALPEEDGIADAAVIHQVLHFLVDPGLALSEAARVLAPDGRLLVVDFARHEVEFLRERHAHRRLGFDRAEIERLGEAAGLAPLDYREIPAPKDRGEDGLTVSLWLFGKST